LATESSNNRNAILIIPIYTISLNHSTGAIPIAERKLCASVYGNICWVKFTKFFSMQMSPKTFNYGGKT